MKVGRSVDKATNRGLFVVQNETGYVQLLRKIDKLQKVAAVLPISWIG